MITDNSKMDVVQNYSVMTLALGIGYAAYYWIYIAKRPMLAGNVKWQNFIHSYCPLICSRFKPTFWCPSARVQTILRIALKKSPRVPVQKEFLDLSDGGHVSLDWLATELPEDTPVVLILPGLIGNGDQSYALHLQKQVQNVGYRSVVFSYRGNGGAHLKTAKTYTACETGDLASVVHHIKLCYPNAPLMAVGVSLGGLILTNYLAKHGRDCGLLAGMTISSPWDLFKSSAMLEEPINRLVFNWPLCNQLKATVKRSAALFEQMFNLDHVFQSQTIRDFDNRFTAPLFGYSSFTEYYNDARIDTKVHNIEIPLLALNSTDDPFSPASGLPLDEASESKCVIIVATSHGGHIGFLEGLLPTGPGYMDRVFAEYISAIFQHGEELQANLHETE